MQEISEAHPVSTSSRLQPPVDLDMKDYDTPTLETIMRGYQLEINSNLRNAREAETKIDATSYLLNAKSIFCDSDAIALAIALSKRRFPGAINLSPRGALAEQTGNYFTLLAKLTPRRGERSYLYYKAVSAFRDWVHFEAMGTEQRQNAEISLRLAQEVLEKSQKLSLLQRILPAQVDFPFILDREDIRDLDL